MDVSHLLDDLNPSQREAVTAPPGHLLVLAGAGSGKTRVLTHRIGWLVEVVGVPAHGILAVTFTNKAAAEMRGRVESLLRGGSRGMWVGTFHGLALRGVQVVEKVRYIHAGILPAAPCAQLRPAVTVSARAPPCARPPRRTSACRSTRCRSPTG